ncbi:BnaC09g29860D [Brassica napus]|uniref:(rape) hypothetical protein n=1 Tax=Brassica napus TaxID=3708 RepID=A0A078HDZ2_BRANA|nr:unnamed protein product [Brassica napus]CDY35664.1 BnaC09g29860D [Brassica napus]
MVINPTGFDVEDYPAQALVPNNELAITMSTEVTTVYAIDTDWAWYYFACLRCDSCKQSVKKVAPQFKLHLLIKDETGENKVMLLDTIAEPIVGVSAEVLLDGSLEEVEDPEDLPDVITALIGKTFKFGVYVAKDNVDYEADIFTIGGTWSANEIISMCEDDNTLLSDHSSGKVSLLSIESEDTKGASSTPVSKRSESSRDSQIEDLSSTSKKQRFKNIKLEKNDGE